MYIHLSMYLSVYIRLTCRGTHTCLASASGKGKPQYTTTREQYFKNLSQSVCLCLSVTVPNLSVITYLYRSALHIHTYTYINTYVHTCMHTCMGVHRGARGRIWRLFYQNEYFFSYDCNLVGFDSYLHRLYYSW